MFKRSSTGLLILSVLMIPIAVLFMSGCDSKSTSEGSSTAGDIEIEITASPTTIDVGATSVIEATVTSGDAVVANQPVWFTVSPTDAGYFTPATDTTDADGVAASVFTSSSESTPILYAWTNSAEDPAEINLTVEDMQQSGGNVDISVSPSLLLANGNDTSSVTVTVRDDLGQVAPDQTVVKLTAGERFVDIDGNGYWSNGIDSLVYDANSNGQWDGIGYIPASAQISGGNGSVTVDYVSGSDAQTVYIMATVEDNGITGNAEVSIQLSPNTEINSIYLSSDSLQLSVKGTGGIETALLRATAYDVNGNPVPEGLPINFLILDGPSGPTGDGEHLGDASVGYGPYSSVTNNQGIATAPIHSGTISGTIRVRAQASDTVLSNAAQVLVSAGPPVYIVVGAEACNVPYWDNIGEKVTITAVVSDVYLNPVNDSTAVYFTTDEGTMKSHEARTEDHEGIANTVWISGNNLDSDPNVNPEDRGAGRVLVIAETAGGTVADTGFFINSHAPDVMTVTGNPASMYADGNTEATVFVDAVDFNNNYVINGTPFEGEAVYSQTGGGSFEDGCYYSFDRIKITAPILDQDHSITGGNDDGIGAVDNICYWSGTASVCINITLLTGSSYTANSSISGETSAGPGETLSFSALIKDRFGNPLGDHTLVMTATDGTVTGGTQSTNSYGEALGFRWQAPALPGKYTVNIEDMDTRGGILLTKTITVDDE